jgi:hypothetical protein
MPSNLPRNLQQIFEIIGFWGSRCYHGSGFHGFNETAEAYSVVLMRPQKWLPWFQCYYGSGFRGFNETMEAASTVSMRPRNPKKVYLPQSQWDCSSFNETAEADAAVSMRLWKRIRRSQWEAFSLSLNSFKGILCQKQIHIQTLHTYSY